VQAYLLKVGWSAENIFNCHYAIPDGLPEVLDRAKALRHDLPQNAPFYDSILQKCS
jgi:hypothetical protein